MVPVIYYTPRTHTQIFSKTELTLRPADPGSPARPASPGVPRGPAAPVAPRAPGIPLEKEANKNEGKASAH